jgi:hypothetical protein
MHEVHVEGEHEDNTCGCMWVKHGKNRNITPLLSSKDPRLGEQYLV